MSSAHSDRIEYAVASDVGRRRANNQDSYLVTLAQDEPAWQVRGDLFVVADGMGAHAAGELASRLAVEGVSHIYQRRSEAGHPRALQQAIVDTNAEIHARGQANSEFHNMGTTCSALVLGSHGALLGHVGDSRVYRLRNSRLEQLTFDHSLVWEMRAMGQALGQHNVGLGLPKNVITRSLGPNGEVQVDLEGPSEIMLGDRYVLCTDGLTGKVTDEELGLIVRCLEPQAAATFLVDLANLRGGPDNITVIVVESKRGQSPSPGVASGENFPARQVLLISGALLAALASIACLVTGYWIAAAGTAAVGGALAAVATRSRQAPHPRPTLGTRSGQGPYTSVMVGEPLELLPSIDQTIEDSCEQAEDYEGVESVRAVRAQLEQARAESERGDFVAACRLYHQVTARLLAMLRNYDDDRSGNLFG